MVRSIFSPTLVTALSEIVGSWYFMKKGPPPQAAVARHAARRESQGWRKQNVVGRGPEQWSQWSVWLAAGLHGRNRWRLPVLLLGMLFAGGRGRTVTTWLRAGVSDDYQDDDIIFLVGVGRKSESVATQLLGLVPVRCCPCPSGCCW